MTPLPPVVWRPLFSDALSVPIWRRYDRCCHGGRDNVPSLVQRNFELLTEWFGTPNPLLSLEGEV